MYMNRIKYLDAIKFIAILSIICIHVAIIWPYSEIKGYNISGFSEFCRFGVPLFLMVTGALLLGREYDLRSFLEKRLTRIIIPFIFWAIIFAVFILILFFSLKNNYLNNYPLEWGWYFWMVLGAYLTIPIINEFIVNKGMRGAKYFIVLFIISSLFYQILIFFNISSFVDLRFFLGPINYIVLGFYLSNKKFSLSTNKIIILSLILFIITSLCKVGLNLVSWENAHLIINDNNLCLLSYLDVSIFEIIQSSSMFLIIKGLYSNDNGFLKNIKDSFLENSIIKKFILSVSKASYGMYLSHVFFITLANYYLANIPLTGTQNALLIVVLSIIIFLSSWILIVITSKIPLIKKVCGYH